MNRADAEARREWQAVLDYDARVSSTIAAEPSRWLTIGLGLAIAAVLAMCVVAFAFDRRTADTPTDAAPMPEAMNTTAEGAVFVEIRFPHRTPDADVTAAMRVVSARAKILGGGRWTTHPHGTAGMLVEVEAGAPFDRDALHRLVANGEAIIAEIATAAEMAGVTHKSFNLHEYLREMARKPRIRTALGGGRIVASKRLPVPKALGDVRYYGADAANRSVEAGGAIVHRAPALCRGGRDLASWTTVTSGDHRMLMCNPTRDGGQRIARRLRLRSRRRIQRVGDAPARRIGLILDEELVSVTPLERWTAESPILFLVPGDRAEQLARLLAAGPLPVRAIAVLHQTKPAVPTAKWIGRIGRVDRKQRFVMMDAGGRHGLTNGMRLRVARLTDGGTLTAVGHVTVDRVYPGTAAASFDAGLSPKAGDLVFLE